MNHKNVSFNHLTKNIGQLDSLIGSKRFRQLTLSGCR